MKIPFSVRHAVPLLCACLLLAQDIPAPVPLLKIGDPVNWWFVFKFNAESFPECGGGIQRTCLFGGVIQPYKGFGQQYVFASSANGTLQQGGGCLGDATTDPLGATFDQIYKGGSYYVLWNDQFYGDPLATQFAPAGLGFLTRDARQHERKKYGQKGARKRFQFSRSANRFRRGVQCIRRWRTFWRTWRSASV